MPKKNDRPRGMANDIIGADPRGHQEVDQDAEGRGAQPGFAVLSLLANDTRARSIQFKEAAAEIMEKAYLKASDNGRLPANARQIMYAARPHIQKVTGNELRVELFHTDIAARLSARNRRHWNVVYDARGHFKEPHDGNGFGIGTLEVRDYLAGLREPFVVDAELAKRKSKPAARAEISVRCCSSKRRASIRCSKAANIANKFDLAIMSTKGMCGHRGERTSRRNVPRVRYPAADIARLRQEPASQLPEPYSATPGATNFGTASRPSILA